MAGMYKKEYGLSHQILATFPPQTRSFHRDKIMMSSSQSTVDEKFTAVSLHSIATQFDLRQEEWHGQPPCVCHNGRGCREHNPTQKAMYRNPNLPPYLPCTVGTKAAHLLRTLVSRQRMPRGAEAEAEAEANVLRPLVLYRTTLPYDAQSVDPLPSLHPTMPYRLAYYHLDCVRYKLSLRAGPDQPSVFIAELSCSGTAALSAGSKTHYAWSTETYFHRNGGFYQKQDMDYFMDPSARPEKVSVFPCPHCAVHTHALARAKRRPDGFVRVTAPRELVRRECRRPFKKLWSSSHGRSTWETSCKFCPTTWTSTWDMTNAQGEVRVHHTCYKFLGEGRDRSSKAWISQLRKDVLQEWGHGEKDRFLEAAAAQ